MDLNSLFEIFVSWQFVFLCLGAYLITYVLRIPVQHFWKGAKTSELYNEVLLPLAPIGNGILLTLCAKAFPLPVEIVASFMAKVIFGGIAGMFSGWVYARFRAFMKKGTKGNNKSKHAPPEE